uniref:Uncharacterized protein n=1 Tax=Rhizophora mucronata TaxID=61149 RepID=A0A2P2KY54_RHIMU
MPAQLCTPAFLWKSGLISPNFFIFFPLKACCSYFLYFWANTFPAIFQQFRV